MSEAGAEQPDTRQAGMKAVIIFLVICPLFIVIIGFLFVAQVNQMRPHVKPDTAQADAGGDQRQAMHQSNAPVTGPSKYSSCVACHGDQAQGISNETVKGPRLAGLSGWYIKKQIEKFKNGQRGAHPEDTMGAQMVPFAKMLATEADVDEVIADIKALAPEEPADPGPGDAVRGQSVLMVCKTCHGQNMEGNEQLGGPPIRQQHAWYLFDALKKFKAGIRGGTDDTPESQQMRGMTMSLATDDDIHNVIAAIQELREE